MRYIIALGLALAAAGSAIAADDPVARMAADKRTWVNFNYWSSMEASPIWNTGGWSDYTGEQTIERTWLKQRETVFAGIPMTAQFSKRNSGDKPWLLVFNTVKAQVADCRNSIAWATAAYGNPTASFDYSQSSPKTEQNPVAIQFLERGAQYELGATRLTVSCMGILFPSADNQTADQTIAVTFNFARPTTQNKLVPLFALSCSRKATFQDGEIRALEPLEFHVDEYGKAVRNLQKDRFGSDTEITADHISFAINTQKLNQIYHIDRRTGRLSGKGVITATSHTTQFSGNCEKIDPNAKKF